MGNNLGQHERLPAKETSERRSDHEMCDKGNEAIKVFPAVVEKWIEAHPVEKYENVAEQDSERMAHEQIGQALAPGDVEKLRLGHDRKGANMRTAQLGVVIMMVIV